MEYILHVCVFRLAIDSEVCQYNCSVLTVL